MQEKRKNFNATGAEEEDIPKENERVGLNEVGVYDTDLYSGGKSKFEGYHTSLALDEQEVIKKISKCMSYLICLSFNLCGYIYFFFTQYRKTKIPWHHQEVGKGNLTLRLWPC